MEDGSLIFISHAPGYSIIAPLALNWLEMKEHASNVSTVQCERVAMDAVNKSTVQKVLPGDEPRVERHFVYSVQ